MNYCFDEVIDRRATECDKWRRFDDDVLPLWVADMDFRSPEPVIQALRQRVDHGVFGYGCDPRDLREVIVERMQRLYDWQITPDSIMLLNGVVAGFNLACRALTSPGDAILLQPPVYPPILQAPTYAGLAASHAPLIQGAGGAYGIDFAAFEAAITERTSLFLLCNPHNPVGRVFTRSELERMAEICLRHNVLICSDEIHCDILFSGHSHTPIASLSPEIAAQTITLMAPSKTFNIAGLHLAFAIVPDPAMRKRLQPLQRSLMGSPNVLATMAALAAYRDGQPWLDDVLAYLQGNCDFLMQFLRERLPMIRMARPEATYLAWLDCRAAPVGDCAWRFFLEKARVALNDGGTFGEGGQPFVRLNFGCPRSTLAEALERMRAAIETA